MKPIYISYLDSQWVVSVVSITLFYNTRVKGMLCYNPFEIYKNAFWNKLLPNVSKTQNLYTTRFETKSRFEIKFAHYSNIIKHIIQTPK